jgi:flagellar hook-associated protein 3 FlgL
MITNLDPSSELFLANVERIQDRLATANRQISSGKKITTASDAPDQIGSLLQLRAAHEHNSQVQSNLVLAKADADAADSALASSIQLMDRAMTLAAQGTNFTQDAATRQSMAQEVDSLLQQMVAFSQTSVQGRYIFSGDRGDSPAFNYVNNAVVLVAPAEATSRVEDPAGGSFLASKTAQEIFDARDAGGNPLPANVFAALSNLRDALLGNDSTTISNAIDPLRQASAHLNTMEAFYGGIQSRIEAATNFSDTYATRLETEMSEKEDADVTSAALELSSATTQLQAAFQMQSRMPHSSLFDYLG